MTAIPSGFNRCDADTFKDIEKHSTRREGARAILTCVEPYPYRPDIEVRMELAMGAHDCGHSFHVSGELLTGIPCRGLYYHHPLS